MIDLAFWRGKRVLITGHSGFKGSWLTFWLSELGAHICGASLAPATELSAFETLNIASRCDHHVVDIRDRNELHRVVKTFDPEIVFHMAAQPFVRYSFENPLETYETNVIGTGNLLMSLRDLSRLRAVVVVTTDKCYENREWHYPYRETDALGGFDPYSSSKACTEIITASFRRSYFGQAGAAGIATARAGNVIGGGDWSGDRLIPDIVRALISNESLVIRYPQSIRPWQHVLSPLSGYMMLAEKLYVEPTLYAEAFNFAPSEDDCVNVQTIIEGFGRSWGGKVPWALQAGPKVHEAKFLKLDSSKARAELQWQPRLQLEDTLALTATWYRTFYKSRNEVETLTRRQIEAFCERPSLEA